MKRLILLGLALALGFGLAFVGGCGDDDESTAPPEKRIGDPNDPEFAMISEMGGDLNFLLDLNLIFINYVLLEQYIDTAGTTSKPAAAFQPSVEVLVVSHDTSNFWHIFECSAWVSYEDSYLYYGGTDSLRFGSDTGYMYIPDTASLNSQNIRAHFKIDFIEATGITADIHSHAGIDLTIGLEDDFTINGYSSDSADLFITFVDTSQETVTCEIGMTGNQTITNILFDAVVQNDEGCPPSGRIDLDFTVSIECDGESPLDTLDLAGAWATSFLFGGGDVTITCENETTRWTITYEDCRPTGAAKLGWVRPSRRLTE